ncbi:PorV/PorQ family protein [Candidatus Latescibacterota bacterium]
MKNYMLTLCTLAVIFTPITSVWGTDNFTGDFLSLGSGARQLGMGSASAATATDATASYYNPALLTSLTSREVNFMHSEQFGGLENYNSISLGAPLTENEYIGITLLHLGVGDIKYTTVWDPSRAPGDSNRVEVASLEDAADYTLFLSGAKHFTDKLDIGTSIKVIRRSVGDDTAFGFGIDLGMRYKLNERITVGANIRDITGTTIAWDGHSNDRIAMTTDIGAAYMGEAPLIGGQYLVTASMLFFGDSPDIKGINTMNFGGEYIIADYIAFRAGSDRGHGTFGMGLKRLPLISSSSFDYAFLSHEEFDSTHRISMTIRF